MHTGGRSLQGFPRAFMRTGHHFQSHLDEAAAWLTGIAYEAWPGRSRGSRGIGEGHSRLGSTARVATTDVLRIHYLRLPPEMCTRARRLVNLGVQSASYAELATAPVNPTGQCLIRLTSAGLRHTRQHSARLPLPARGESRQLRVMGLPQSDPRRLSAVAVVDDGAIVAAGGAAPNGGNDGLRLEAHLVVLRPGV